MNKNELFKTGKIKEMRSKIEMRSQGINSILILPDRISFSNTRNSCSAYNQVPLFEEEQQFRSFVIGEKLFSSKLGFY